MTWLIILKGGEHIQSNQIIISKFGLTCNGAFYSIDLIESIMPKP